MRIKQFIFQVVVCALLSGSCTEQKESITRLPDYEKYLDTEKNEAKEKARAEKDFWENKLKTHPDQYAYLQPLAAAYSTLFDVSGNISALLKAEELLVQANDWQLHKNAALQRALARNYITQHRFKEALIVLKNAEKIGEKLKSTQKMLFDVYLELGNTKQAELYLSKIKSINDFDYLIRLAKWSDHNGNLDAAIKYMEKAMNIAETSRNKRLQLWSYSNIGDFYGHAGRIRDAYTHYLKALEIDPDFTYALQGIAWIAFSHEKDTEKALRIIDFIITRHKTPDIYLLKADVAEYMDDEPLKAENKALYHQLLKTNLYGVMYDRHTALLLAENKETVEKAMALARQEIANRPTPQSYDLLAWTYFEKGQPQKALEIMQQHVIGKTYEPEVQYHLAEIYKANNKPKEVSALKKELMGSLFELGPNMKSRITNL